LDAGHHNGGPARLLRDPDVVEGEEAILEDMELKYTENNPELLRKIFLDKELFQMENVVFTPHTGFNSEEALERLLQISISNLRKYASGEDNPYLIN